MHEKEEREG